MVLLLLPVQGAHVPVVARQVDGVVPLDVVQARQECAVIDLERDGVRIRPAEGVRDRAAKDMASITYVAERPGLAYRAEEPRRGARSIVAFEIQLFEIVGS